MPGRSPHRDRPNCKYVLGRSWRGFPSVILRGVCPKRDEGLFAASINEMNRDEATELADIILFLDDQLR
jgi:hypothetical protein